jgi:hypothetical protein
VKLVNDNQKCDKVDLDFLHFENPEFHIVLHLALLDWIYLIFVSNFPFLNVSCLILIERLELYNGGKFSKCWESGYLECIDLSLRVFVIIG